MRPGALAILLLSVLYAEFRHLPAIAALFLGLKAAVVAVVVEAVLGIGKRRAERGIEPGLPKRVTLRGHNPIFW
jgi:chromate transporter